MLVYAFFIVSALMPTSVLTFSRGAPPGICKSMKPGHGQQSPEPAPFTVNVVGEKIFPGSKVTVNIAATDNQTVIMGILVQAKSKQQAKYLGSFDIQPRTKSTCSENNGLTHKQRLMDSNLNVVWNAPTTLVQNDVITFNVTVVKDRLVYWRGIESKPLAVDTSSPTTEKPAILSTHRPSIVLQPGRLAELKRNPACGVTVGCFQDCTSDKCGFNINWSYEAPHIRFEMSAVITGTNKWIAVGFSDDTKMGDDLVIECVSSNGQVDVHVSFNEGKSNQRRDEFTHGFIHPMGSYRNGVLHCSFTVDIHVDFGKQFTLNHHLMFAEGDSRDGQILPHSFSKLPMVTDVKVNFQSVKMLGGEEPQFPLVKAHGTLMIISWLISSSIGLIFARYGKPLWENKTPFGIKLWFHVHRVCMFLTLIATLLALLLILIEAQGFSKIPYVKGRLHWQVHPVLGFMVVILTIANPIMAFFRPDGDAPKRFVFNWCHRSVGVIAFILAVIAVFIGLDLNKSNVPKAFVAIMVIYIIYMTVFIVLMEALPLIVKLVEGRNNKTTPINDLNHSDAVTTTNSDASLKSRDENKLHKMKEEKYTKILLFIHITAVVFLSLILIIMILHGS